MNKMKVLVSPFDETTKNTKLGQDVFFINVLNTFDDSKEKPIKVTYEQRDTISTALLLNYQDYDSEGFFCDYTQGYAPIAKSEESMASIYKQEVSVGDDKEIKALTRLKPVKTDINNFKFRDFNISNHRLYQYVLYPSNARQGEEIEKATVIPNKTNWGAWSITELHPVAGNKKQFTATADDVWLFNLNVETGEQSQNISRNEQQTLGQFNKYSQGRTNYISGSVSCLLGSEVIPASYIKRKNEITNSNGGYTERRIFDTKPTSNERVDMLLAWRKVVYSSNPKLLKDRAGQSFLVTLNSSSNKPMDAVGIQPNTISFNWTQIGTTEDLQIIDDTL